MRQRAAIVVAMVVAATIVSTLPGTVRAATRGRTVTSKRIAKGVVYRRIVDPKGPWVVYTITVAPSAKNAIDPILAASTMGPLARTSQMAQAGGAIAAINGDFGGWYGHPTHPAVDDGDVVVSGTLSGATLGVTPDKKTDYMLHGFAQIHARNLTLKTSATIGALNIGAPGANSIVAYTSYGGKVVRPPSNGCFARLKFPSKQHWGKADDGTYRDWVIGAAECGSTMSVQPGQVVLASRQSGTGSRWMRALKRRQHVRVAWGNAMPGVVDEISGNPWLVNGGVVQATDRCRSYFCSRNPRTAVGYTADHHVVFFVVDGRLKNSVGMTPFEEATFLQSLGVVDAVNLDGGGSSTMWIKGMGVVNHPSDSTGERAVIDALLLLPGADVSEPTPRAYSTKYSSKIRALTYRDGRARVAPSYTSSASFSLASWRRSLRDPGSTGGLMDWIVSSAHGRTRADLPAEVFRIADRFRAAH
ncbi:MAG: phosphodiester glycosidase family protein [Planctomycetaceae bacterium]